MNILDIENDIVAKLQAEITDTDIEIRSFPADPQTHRILREAAILVRYQGSQYTEPEPNRAKIVNQIRTVSWVVSVMSIDVNPLTGHRGVYTYLQQIRQALTGYTIGTQSSSAIDYASMMYPVSDNYTFNKGSLWIYEMVFNHKLEEVNTT